MNVNIHGRNVKVTDGLEEYVQRKLNRLDRYLPNLNDVRVDLDKQNTRRGEDLAIAQITVRHNRGAILRAEVKQPGEIHHAIDEAVDKMYARIERFKGKRRSKRRRSERFVATAEELSMAEEMLPEIPDAALNAEAEEEVLRRKHVELLPMNEAEAIEQLELLGHSFFMFLNADTGGVNVLYKRDEGGYGLLQPAS